MRPAIGLASALATTTALALAVASCGSRTELWGAAAWGDEDAGRAPAALFDAGSTTDAGPDGGVPCVPGTFSLERGIAKVMLVLDRSGSMSLSLSSNEPPPPGEPSRWDALRSSVSDAVAPFDTELALGVTLFPAAFDSGETTNGCTVAEIETVPPKVGNVTAVLASMSRGKPYGGTPTVAALESAAGLLRATRGTVRALVLATDGAPNCNAYLDPHTCTCTTSGQTGGCGAPGDGSMCLDDHRAVAKAAEIASTDKIPVYVLGIADDPGASFSQTLDAMAIAGGRPRSASPRYYPARSPGELTAALASIRDGVARCTYLTPSAPDDETGERMQVLVDGLAIARDPARQEGWDWVDQKYGQLAFFGSACTRVSGGASVPVARVACSR